MPPTRNPCWRAGARRIASACPPGACAYATLVLNDRFMPYAFALHRSLRTSGSVMPFVILATPEVTDSALEALVRLEARGDPTRHFEEAFEAARPIDNMTFKELGTDLTRRLQLGTWPTPTYKRLIYTTPLPRVRALTPTSRAAQHTVDRANSTLRIERIEHVQYPSRYTATHEDGETRKSLRFTKLEAWRLTEYQKVAVTGGVTHTEHDTEPARLRKPCVC